MPLTYRDRGTTGTQLDVMSGDVRIGRISKDVLSLATVVSWSWTIYIDAGPPGFMRHGSADTGEEAKVGFERNWQLWLTAAGLAER